MLPGGPEVDLLPGLLVPVVRDDVADDDVRPRRGRLFGGGRRTDTLDRRERTVDLAEFHAATAELDLVVGTAGEDEPLAVGDDEVAGLSPVHRLTGGRVDHGEPPPGGRPADTYRLTVLDLVHQLARRYDCGLGGAVGVPQLPAVPGEPVHELDGEGLAPEDQQADVVEGVDRPERRQRGHRRHRADPVVRDPGSEGVTGAHHVTWRGDEGGAVAPGEPHLLTGGVEGDGQPRHDPVTRVQGVAGQVHPGLGVDEGRRGAVGDGHALRRPRGAGGEDDPGVVVHRGGGRSVRRGRGRARFPRRTLCWFQDEAGAEDGGDVGLGPDLACPRVGVVPVHRDVGGSGRQGGEDRDVEVGRARRYAHTNPVPRPDACPGQPLDLFGDAGGQLFVGEFGVPTHQG